MKTKTKKTAPGLRVVIVEERTLRRRAIEQRLQRISGIEIVAAYPGIEAARKKFNDPTVDAFCIGDHQLSDWAMDQLRRWSDGRRTRLIAVMPESIADDGLMLGTPLNAIIHLAQETVAIVRAITGGNAYEPCVPNPPNPKYAVPPCASKASFPTTLPANCAAPFPLSTRLVAAPRPGLASTAMPDPS